MKDLIKCIDCGKAKKQDEFPTRGKELNRFGRLIYRKYCKACDAIRRTERNQKKKETSASPIYKKSTPIQTITIESEYKSPQACEGYDAWTSLLGRNLQDEEKLELDSCARELIITMMDLVFKEKGV